MGFLRGCTGLLLFLALLVGAAFAGWKWGPDVVSRARVWVGRAPASPRVPSPELADSALARIERLDNSPGETRLSFDSAELESLLRYKLARSLPTAIHEPGVTLENGRAVLSGRVPVEAFPRIAELADVIAFLPDTVPVRIEAALIPLTGGRAAVLVNGIEAARVPIPRRFVPDILAALGRRAEPDVPTNALAFSLPESVTAAYIVNDSLYLIGAP